MANGGESGDSAPAAPGGNGVKAPTMAAAAHSHGEERDAQGRKIYRCGTLKYTVGGLVALIAWLLWGDFCFTMMEHVVPSIMPLKLRSMQSANWVIALIMSTLPGIFNTTVCPWVSFKSDTYRSKWGRRIPFIVYTMPFLVVSLILIGLSDDIGGWLHGWFLGGSTITRSAVVVVLLAVFAGIFDLFNMFVGSVYWYLFNDVVPERFLASFMSWFRLIGTLSGALYNYFIFRFALSHMREIYLGAALLYLFGFGLMCLMVKEGEYPPSPDEGRKPSLLRDIKTFAKDCFTMPYYWYIFLQCMFAAIGGSIGVFGVFFNQSMGLDLNLIGKMAAVGSVVAAVFMTFAGILVDRWHPVRVEIYINAYGAFFAFGSTIWLFAVAPPSMVYFWVGIAGNVFSALMSAVAGAASLPRLMLIFPKDQFGQFCGAQALVRSAGTMIGGLVAGIYLDVVKRFYPPGDLFPYRYMYIWTTIFAVLAFAFHYRAFRCWKRLGGESGYTPPLKNFRYRDLPKAENSLVTRSLLIPPIIAFVGALSVHVFYVYYFHSVAHNARNALVFGIYAVIMVGIMAAYLRFIRFMERP